MSDLNLAFDLPGTPAVACAALSEPLILRCWYGAPPGWSRVGAGGSLAPGRELVLDLRDARGGTARHTLGLRWLEPGRLAELTLAFDGGPLAGPPTRATLAFEPAGAGVRVTVAHALADPAQQAAAEAFWRGCFGRLATMQAGGVVSPAEELANELHAFHDPIGVALFGVLAGLREAGAPAAAVREVEAIALAHLPNLAEEPAALLDALMRERLAVIDGWQAALALAETPT